jgi:diadenylate cyclase
MELAFITLRLLDVVDILLLAFLLSQVYFLLKGTTAINIVTGVFALYVLWLLVKALNMQLLSSVLGQFIGVGVIALIIVFQPELRKALLLLGSRQVNKRYSFFRLISGAQNVQEEVKIKEIVTAVRSLSLSKTGGLIVIQKNNNLISYLTVKDILDAETSSRLINNIFFKNSPLHDGAIVIIGSKIHAARCVLPVSEKPLPAQYGLRHRAAVGISELTDAVAIAVSEETGKVAIAREGVLFSDLDSKKVINILENEFLIHEDSRTFIERIAGSSTVYDHKQV